MTRGMNVTGFFSDVEARVGAVAPLEQESGARPASWLSEELDLMGVSMTDRVELLGHDEASDPGDLPAGFFDAARWIDREDDDWTDAVAAYRPWHTHHHRWGIVVNAWQLGAFTGAVAQAARVRPARLAPFVLRQVLAHEHVHFSFELAATEIEDLLGEPRYVHYATGRYELPNRWTPGPLEEVVATWAESTYAAGLPTGGSGAPPKGYRRAIEQVNAGAPPGYADFGLMADARRAERIVADVAGLIADREVWSGRWWPRATAEDCAQVPLYWLGLEEWQPLFGIGKSVSPPSMRDFEHWLYSVVGARRLRGTKHAKAELPNGRRITYKDDGAELYPNEAQQIAHKTGLRNRRELYLHVADRLMPPMVPVAV